MAMAISEEMPDDDNFLAISNETINNGLLSNATKASSIQHRTNISRMWLWEQEQHNDNEQITIRQRWMSTRISECWAMCYWQEDLQVLMRHQKNVIKHSPEQQRW